MIPAAARRVVSNTAQHVNEQIGRQIGENVRRFADGGGEEIAGRLEELDREWDIERYLETMAPTFTLIGLGLGLAVDRKWFILPVVVQTFFLQHALQGWCPPVPLLRRLGLRTTSEIDLERNAPKALRGDYQRVHADGHDAGAASRALRAAAR